MELFKRVKLSENIKLQKDNRKEGYIGWMGGWVDGWMDGQMDRQTDRRMDGRTDGWIDR